MKEECCTRNYPLNYQNNLKYNGNNALQIIKYNYSKYLINPTSGVYFPIPNVGGIAIRRDNTQIACTYLDVKKSS